MNLRHLLDTFTKILKEGDFVAVDDLRSGYWHCSLHPSMYQLCGVHYHDPESCELTLRVWKVLFLGVKDAVYVFTHLLRPVVHHMRLVGWTGSININNLSTLVSTYLQCQYWRLWAMDVMAQNGWVFSESKMRDPSKLPVFLGVTVDTLWGTFHGPQANLDDMLVNMKELLVLRKALVRRLASVVGKLVTAYRSSQMIYIQFQSIQEFGEAPGGSHDQGLLSCHQLHWVPLGLLREFY